MSTKSRSYSVGFKAKVVLETQQTLNEIASKYELLPLSLIFTNISHYIMLDLIKL